MAIDLTGINNVNEFYTDHYLASILEQDLKDLFKQWSEAEKEQDIIPPDRKLSALSREYFRTRAALERIREPQAIMAAQRPFLAGLLDALGYAFATTEQPLDGNEATLPLIAGVTKDSGAPDLWVIETICPVVEMQDPLDLHLHVCQYQDGALAIIPDHNNLDELITRRVFTRSEPPRWIVLVSFGTAILLDRSKWNEKRFLHFDLHEILSRREPSTLKALAALLHRDSICPGEGIPLIDALGENSHKHAYSVSEDLKYAVREAVELLGNEAMWYLRERRRRGVFGSTDSAEAVDPALLSRECLRYLYRLLFLFYIEARPELGYAPLNSEEYRLGYSLESLRELEMVPLTTIYRLAGRNRQKSASYYTPEVLTQCVVKYALKELLKDKTADDILHLTVCEPAMGSGAFLNEAINQLAEAYMKTRMKAEG